MADYDQMLDGESDMEPSGPTQQGSAPQPVNKEKPYGDAQHNLTRPEPGQGSMTPKTVETLEMLAKKPYGCSK